MPDEISPEDRERLAKAKYAEWFDECWSRKFGEAFDQRVTEMSEAIGKPPTGEVHAQKGAVSSEHPSSRGRRSIFEKSLSEALGLN